MAILRIWTTGAFRINIKLNATENLEFTVFKNVFLCLLFLTLKL